MDGIIFVADSQLEKMESNLDSLKDLETNLKAQGYDITKLPIVIQWNKRDLPNISSVKDMEKQLNKHNFTSFEAVAIKGTGVFETLKAVTKLVLMNLKGGL